MKKQLLLLMGVVASISLQSGLRGLREGRFYNLPEFTVNEDGSIIQKKSTRNIFDICRELPAIPTSDTVPHKKYNLSRLQRTNNKVNTILDALRDKQGKELSPEQKQAISVYLRGPFVRKSPQRHKDITCSYKDCKKVVPGEDNYRSHIIQHFGVCTVTNQGTLVNFVNHLF